MQLVVLQWEWLWWDMQRFEIPNEFLGNVSQFCCPTHVFKARFHHKPANNFSHWQMSKKKKRAKQIFPYSSATDIDFVVKSQEAIWWRLCNKIINQLRMEYLTCLLILVLIHINDLRFLYYFWGRNINKKSNSFCIHCSQYSVAKWKFLQKVF